MTRQHTVCINTTIFKCLITNSMRTRGARYSHPVLVTHLCKNFLSDNVFDSYDRVFVAPEQATSAYNSYLRAVWTPSVQPEDAQAVSSSDKLLEEMMTRLFGSRPYPRFRAFMSTIWKGMKKIFKGQVRLKKQMEEQTTHLDHIEEGLRQSQSAGPSTTVGPSRRRG